MSDHATSNEENGFPQTTLLEQILDSANIHRAWERVRSNKGAAGIDKMSVSDFPKFARAHLGRIVKQIREGRYAPAPVHRVWIPKPNGEKRPLGIPTVLDRVIQQAIAQKLSPIFDVDFTEQSYGFRQGRQAHAAIAHVSEHSQNGYHWGVDCDLKSYFDTVNHDLLMNQISKRINDKSVLKLIGKYLRAGVRHEDGVTEKTLAGVPQGGPLSPLLANIMAYHLGELKRYCQGWFHYFKYGLPYAEALRFDQWIRRRVRLCYWKDWKLPRKRRRMLIRLGVDPEKVKLASRSRKGYWRLSRNSLVSLALNDKYLKAQGLPSLRELWVVFKYGNKAKL